uniref:Uncharacterized protein n=1 Tax=Anguilla anguilla TaxID=7936 RepID=A0A0E9TZI1_ANGAN
MCPWYQGSCKNWPATLPIAPSGGRWELQGNDE